MQHETDLVMDWPANVHLIVKVRVCVGRRHVELTQDITQEQTLHGPVNHDPECSVFVVLANEGHGLKKIRILKFGHRNQKVISKTRERSGLCVRHWTPPKEEAPKRQVRVM